MIQSERRRSDLGEINAIPTLTNGNGDGRALSVASTETVASETERLVNSRSFMSEEEKLQSLLSVLHLRHLSAGERAKPGISSLDDAANKIFDSNRVLTESDLSGLDGLRPDRLAELVEEALYWELDPSRIVSLCEYLAQKQMPLNVRALSALRCGQAYKKLDDSVSAEDCFIDAIKLSEGQTDGPEQLNCYKSATALLGAHYWNTLQFAECARICEARIQLADKYPEATWARVLRSSAMEQRIKSLALSGRLDLATAALSDAQTADLDDRRRELFHDESFLDKLGKMSRSRILNTTRRQ
jgi:hypothetical protein